MNRKKPGDRRTAQIDAEPLGERRTADDCFVCGHRGCVRWFIHRIPNRPSRVTWDCSACLTGREMKAS